MVLAAPLLVHHAVVVVVDPSVHKRGVGGKGRVEEGRRLVRVGLAID
jgi:hypothetical protein